MVVATTFVSEARSKSVAGSTGSLPLLAKDTRKWGTRVGFVDQLTRGFERNQATLKGDCERGGGEGARGDGMVKNGKS